MMALDHFTFRPMVPIPLHAVRCLGCRRASGEHWHGWLKEDIAGIQYGLFGPSTSEELAR